jgi:hypothetical protein
MTNGGSQAAVLEPDSEAVTSTNQANTESRARAGAASRPAQPALDLHEGIADPRSRSGSSEPCLRWPEHFFLLNHSTGELVCGCCRATNLCARAAQLFAIETSEMLMLDAMEDSPSLYVVLTARELLDRRDCRFHLQQLRRALRRRWPDVRWAVLVEFQRRGALHLNLLVKGVPVDDADELRDRVRSFWCSRVNAVPKAQFVGRVHDGAGLVRYISHHFMKPAQAPPVGWRGHRFSSTRDYLVRPAKLMREEARRSLRLKRLMHVLDDAEIAEAELVVREAQVWSMVDLRGGADPQAQYARSARRPLRRLLLRRERWQPAGGPVFDEP